MIKIWSRYDQDMIKMDSRCFCLATFCDWKYIKHLAGCFADASACLVKAQSLDLPCATTVAIVTVSLGLRPKPRKALRARQVRTSWLSKHTRTRTVVISFWLGFSTSYWESSATCGQSKSESKIEARQSFPGQKSELDDINKTYQKLCSNERSTNQKKGKQHHATLDIWPRFGIPEYSFAVVPLASTPKASPKATTLDAKDRLVERRRKQMLPVAKLRPRSKEATPAKARPQKQWRQNEKSW